jgi:hypothetical protein
VARVWGSEEIHKDWVVAVRAGKPAPFGYAGPFTEAYQLVRYLTRECRRGWDLREIAGRGAFQDINV